MATRGIRGALMEYFAKHPNEPVFLKDLVEATGLITVQVQGNISNIMRDHRLGYFDFNIERISAGQVWMYKPGTTTPVSTPTSEERNEAPARNDFTYGKRTFEELGTTKRGSIVIQDDEGNLYTAVQLEI